ncbi:SpoIIE family protein phosphatase [Chondromyces apiculatus]|uniref:Anti-sigma B factor RsbT / Phosphoserine phosphatase RsbX n=1 Tax=Chondromyces apiculatus DSM 436 TaxID=1192034 RepID=A0A017TF54_9BACT|nr:SpoIIE family protein phosphatase [Chondromyces apiculatus]EYF07874.1 Anti-sigma B factor RsbT / Phosphoserine phosphatase RsbX [Chondromyces apiculatus DSM 436]
MKVSESHVIVPKDGEQLSGDAVFVRHLDRSSLFAVIDALGHGDRAAETSAVALDALKETSGNPGVGELIDLLHTRLRGTRGAAAMVCVCRDGQLEGCSVGNVELLSLGTRIPWVPSPGILGASLRRTRIFEVKLVPGDRLILLSDGVSPRIEPSLLRGQNAHDACRTLMSKYRRPHDDATVMVADIEL